MTPGGTTRSERDRDTGKMLLQGGTGVRRCWGRTRGWGRSPEQDRDTRAGRGHEQSSGESPGQDRSPGGAAGETRGAQNPRLSGTRTRCSPAPPVPVQAAGSPSGPGALPGTPGRLPRSPRSFYLAHTGQGPAGRCQRPVELGGAGALRGHRRFLIVLRPQAPPPPPPQGHGRAGPVREPLYGPGGRGHRGTRPFRPQTAPIWALNRRRFGHRSRPVPGLGPVPLRPRTLRRHRGEGPV